MRLFMSLRRVMTGGDPDTLVITVAEGYGGAVADFGATDTSSVI